MHQLFHQRNQESGADLSGFHGLFWFDRYKALAEAALNLVLSILLVRQYQTLGVIYRNVLSTILTSVGWSRLSLYRRRLHRWQNRFYLRYLCMRSVWSGMDCDRPGLADWQEGSPLTVLLIRLPLCVVLPNLLFLWHTAGRKEWKRVLEACGISEWGRLHRGEM